MRLIWQLAQGTALTLWFVTCAITVPQRRAGAQTTNGESGATPTRAKSSKAAKAKDTRSIDELIKATESKVWKQRWDAVNELGNRRDAAATEALVKRALYDDNPHPRWRALWAVAAVDKSGERAVPLMQKGLKSSDPIVVRNAAVALSTYGHEDARAELLRGLRDEDELRRWEAVFCLRKVGNDEVTKALIPLLDAKNEPTVRVRSEVVLALGRMAGGEAQSAVLKALTGDQSPEVRWRAAMTLAYRDDAAALPELKKARESEKDEKVRSYLDKGILRLEGR